MDEFTSLHDAEPISAGDPIVNSAIIILHEAEEALRFGQGYNANGIGFADYCPRGVDSIVEAIQEPVVRAAVSGQHDKHRDSVAYVALFMAWMRAGMPESRFAEIMRKHSFEHYRMIRETAMQDPSIKSTA